MTFILIDIDEFTMRAAQRSTTEQHLKEYHTKGVDILLEAEVLGPQENLGRTVRK
jgi:hypothetical protein